jgi:hypothetical protein
VSSKEFHVHSKKLKIVLTPSTTTKATTVTTTVATTGAKQFSFPFGSSQHKEGTKEIEPKDSPLDTPPSKTGPKLGIFEKYDLIRKRNQTLTSSTYAQFQKQSSTA